MSEIEHIDWYEAQRRLIRGGEVKVTQEWLMSWGGELNHPDYAINRDFHHDDSTNTLRYRLKTKEEKLQDRINKLESTMESMKRFGAANVFPHQNY